MANRKVKRSVSRKTRRSMYRKKNSKVNRRGLAFASRKNRRTRRAARRSRRTRRQRGGDYIEGMSRPFFASVYPNSLQSVYASATGAEPNNYPGNPSPENMTADHSWSYVKNGTIIPPDVITKINTGFTLMASNTPYAPTPLMVPGAGVSSGSAVVPSATGVSGAGAAGAGAGAGAAQTSIVANIERGTQLTQTF
jgi:hypothetical protein